MNFFEPIYHQLLQKADEVLIRWPNNSRSTGTSLLNLISKYQSVLPTGNESILIAQAFNEDTLAILLACIANGNPILTYPKNFNSKQLKSCFKENEIKFAFAKKTILKIYLRYFSIKCFGKAPVHSPTISIKQVEGTHVALKSFSSGSTGIHKQINRTHALLAEQVNAIDKSFNYLSEKIDFPLFANILLYNLSIGKSTVIPDIKNFDLQTLEVKNIITQLNSNKIQSLTGNEFYFTKICKYLISQKIKIKTVTDIGIGGSPITNKLIQNLKNCFPKAEIQVIYGCTEAEPISIKKCIDEASPAYWGYNVGKIHPSIEIKIDTPQKLVVHDCAVQAGQIFVRGTHVASDGMNGYLQTGDYGFLLNDELYLSARIGNTSTLHSLQHLQLEHCIEFNTGIQTAILIKNEKLNIYSEHPLNAKEIEKILFVNYGKIFPIQIIRKRLPKDPRHLSKILYYRLNEF
jgi:acyl-CoA synthetase (AMP-forming)/AMP-acid ligase II